MREARDSEGGNHIAANASGSRTQVQRQSPACQGPDQGSEGEEDALHRQEESRAEERAGSGSYSAGGGFLGQARRLNMVCQANY